MEPIRSLEAGLEPLGTAQTVRVTVRSEHGQAEATIPAGITTGAGEAKAVDPTQAVATITSVVAPALVGQDSLDQRAVDARLMDLDGTDDRSHLGVNALLPVSLAVARLAAQALDRPLYEHLAELSNTEPRLPETIVVAVEGGRHTAKSRLAIQEFSVIDAPDRAAAVIDRLEQHLKQAGHTVTTGGEGGLVLGTSRIDHAGVLQALVDAASAEGAGQPRLALDVAASHGAIPEAEVKSLITRFPIALIEDPLEESQLEAWARWTKELGKTHLIAADDLTVGNPRMIKEAVQQGVANCLVVKLNQTATLSELLDLVDLVRVGGWQVVVSHRGLETPDDFIADLAVGIGAEFLKAGSPRRPERQAKYARLNAIREHLQAQPAKNAAVPSPLPTPAGAPAVPMLAAPQPQLSRTTAIIGAGVVGLAALALVITQGWIRPSADTAGDLKQTAETAFAAGDFTAAAVAYGQLYADQRGDAEIQQRYLAALMSSHQSEPAATLATELLGRGETTPDTRVVAANALALAGKTDEAASAYQAVLTASPNHPVAAMNLADLYLRTERPDEAKTLVESAIAAHPKEPLLQWLLAQIFDELDNDAAAASARSAAQALEESTS